MNPSEFRLLFHHHDIAYCPNSQDIWLTSGIGRWISELAKQFGEISLLLHESERLLPKQDYQITESNVKLLSLGTPGHYVDHFSRMRRIRKICQIAGTNADGLLIRGLTPSQYAVWQHTPVKHKAFLLVRSPKQKRLLNKNPISFAVWLANKYRENEFDRIVRSDTLMIANSPVHITELETAYNVRAHFVPTNTIRRNEFSPFHIREISTPLRLFFCGRIHALKGIRELFESIVLLHQEGINCRLDLAGAFEEPGYSEALQLADQLGIESYIHWHGQIPFGEDLLKLYRTADIFILPTYTEGFPRVIWEASANCCPVITTAVGGIPALIEHEKHALLVPPKDVQSLVSAVKRLVSDAALRRRLVGHAYEHALDFTVEACAGKLVKLLAAEW